MLDKKDTTLLKLDCKNKDKVYDLLFGKASDCLKHAETLALLYLGSPYYMVRALEEYNIKEVNIFTTRDFKFIYEPFENAEHVRIWYVDDVKNTFKDCDMNFDCIIMNPPYERNLHLKILAEAIKHLKDEKSVCVNLSPDNWLHDFADTIRRSDYNKFKTLPFKSIEHIGLLSKYFDIGHTTYSCAVYVCCLNGNYDLSKSLCRDISTGNIVLPATVNKSLKSKIVNFIKTPQQSLEGNIKSGEIDSNTKYVRIIPRLVGNPGYRCSCLASIGSKRWDKTFFKGKCNGITVSDTKKKLRNVLNYSSFDYLEFNSEESALNWRNSCNANFMRYVCTLVHVDSHRHAQWIPWMGDAINPRTGKKGYESEWTDEDFVLYFGITPEEHNIIKQTMEKYK